MCATKRVENKTFQMGKGPCNATSSTMSQWSNPLYLAMCGGYPRQILSQKYSNSFSNFEPWIKIYLECIKPHPLGEGRSLI